jgi:uncharacterized protein YbjT (DUF2867 family)
MSVKIPGIKVIITGATGMVGEGVLLECLDNPAVERVLIFNRKPLGRTHAKLTEIIHADFFDISPLAPQLAGYDACFFCLGVSSLGMDQDAYKRVTQDLTLGFAQVLKNINPDMTFTYVTGRYTDQTGTSRQHWARVKGATENALLAMFKNAYMFRPHGMQAMPGQRNLPKAYRLLFWIFPPLIALMPKAFCTLRDLARAMIAVATKGDATRVLEVKDIVRLGRG